ncbi:unnamed protein product [Rotaria sordida]|uniref:Uncharacterized protein n=1 Tax=Rotaria sordida TaxID=392033 RepID=A0A819GQ56_9BILA|nr:unnamed protein product [Rotaria sordida]CAF3887758.1 unnamed protein product [Rotaria sordida]
MFYQNGCKRSYICSCEHINLPSSAAADVDSYFEYRVIVDDDDDDDDGGKIFTPEEYNKKSFTNDMNSLYIILFDYLFLKNLIR